MEPPLMGQVALVAGATRGAGRGIARELAAAGAKVYCTGRSTRAQGATPGRPESIDETVELIESDGGRAVAIRVDHTVEEDLQSLAARLERDEGRLDVLVNDIWGGDALIDWTAKFWGSDLGAARSIWERAVFSHLATARYLAPMMVSANAGLIIEVTDGELSGYRGNLLYDLAKADAIRLAYAMAWDLADTNVTALAITPGFLRSEAMLERFGVAEANWRDSTKAPWEFQFSETPRFLGRAVAALAADPQVRTKSGGSFCVGDLAEEYGFNDVDGSRPHFWRNIEASLDERLGSPELDGHWRWMALARYLQIHREPSYGREARAYARALDLSSLPGGLQPS
jgi:NAD(P)-dependent dehydrogenase (short-subunit alcohol dehydrogenase family)